METQALDDLALDDAVAVHHGIKAELDGTARRAKQALAARGLDISLFFLTPSGADGILIFGTPDDLDDDLWQQVREIVSAIVRQAVGLERTRCREVVCATTDAMVCASAAVRDRPEDGWG